MIYNSTNNNIIYNNSVICPNIQIQYYKYITKVNGINIIDDKFVTKFGPIKFNDNDIIVVTHEVYIIFIRIGLKQIKDTIFKCNIQICYEENGELYSF